MKSSSESILITSLFLSYKPFSILKIKIYEFCAFYSYKIMPAMLLCKPVGIFSTDSFCGYNLFLNY